MLTVHSQALCGAAAFTKGLRVCVVLAGLHEEAQVVAGNRL